MGSTRPTDPATPLPSTRPTDTFQPAPRPQTGAQPVHLDQVPIMVKRYQTAQMQVLQNNPLPGLDTQLAVIGAKTWAVELRIILGDEEVCYSLKICFPENCPLSPPKVFRISPKPPHGHPYMSDLGQVGLPLCSRDRWAPARTIRAVLEEFVELTKLYDEPKDVPKFEEAAALGRCATAPEKTTQDEYSQRVQDG